MTSRQARRMPGPAGVAIAGTGMSVPPRTLTNADLEKMVDTSDEWIVQRTGIQTRQICQPGDRTRDLAVAAVRQALDRAGLEPTDLDLLLCATMTPDMICPALSCQVVAELGGIPAGAMDINIACTGFVAGLTHGANAVMSGNFRNVAVIAAEMLTRIVDWEDRSTCVLFGDAASAAILTASDDPDQGCYFQQMGSDGLRGQVLYVPEREEDIPESEKDNFSGKFGTLQMNGKAVYKFAVEKLAECVGDALDATGLTADDITMVVPHQSNIRMLKSAWKRLGFDESKIYMNIDRYGNTSAASVGICLHELAESGRVGPGDYVIFVAQGGGLSWGTCLWKL